MKRIIILPIFVIIMLIKITLAIQVYENVEEDTTDIPKLSTTVLTSTTTTIIPPSIITSESPEEHATVVFQQNIDVKKKTPTTYATRKPFQNLSTAVTKLHTMTTASFKHNVETTRQKYHQQQEQTQQKQNVYLVKEPNLTNNKKRQLFGKENDKPLMKNNNVNVNVTENGSVASSSKNTENNFVPSLQLTPSYGEYKTLSSNNYDSDFHPTNEYYKPIKFDSNYQFPYKQQYQQQDIVQQPLHHREQHHYQNSQLQQNFNNGKQQEHQQFIAQQIKPTDNDKTKEKWSETWQEPYENGKFVWVPYGGSTSTTTIPTTSMTIAATSKQPLLVDEQKSNDNDNENKQKGDEEQLKYINGKWKWITEDNDNVEGKIITNFPQTPSYYEQIKIYQDYKPTITIKEPPPYSYEIVNNNSPFNYHSHGYYGSKDNYEHTTLSTSTTMATTSPTTESTKIKENDNDDDDFIKPIHPISPWKKIIHVLTAAIPIGLIISALTPRVVYINPNTTDLNGGQPTNTFTPGIQKIPTFGFYPGRQRSVDNINTDNELNIETIKELFGLNNLEELNDSREDLSTARGQLTNPLMDFLNIFGDSHNYDHSTSCDDRIFCEMSRMGIENDSDVLYRMLWRIANETTNERAKRSGLGDVFAAIRENRCFIYKCETLDQNNKKIELKRNNRRKFITTKKQPKEINF